MDYISTGQPSINRVLNGGYRRGTLNAVVGANGVGKTAVLLASAVGVINEGGEVLYLDLSGNDVKRYEVLDLLGHKSFRVKGPVELQKKGAIECEVTLAHKAGVNLVILDGDLSKTQLNVNTLSNALSRSNTTVLLGAKSNTPRHPWAQLLLDTQLFVGPERDTQGNTTGGTILQILKSRTCGGKYGSGVIISFKEGCLLQANEIRPARWDDKNQPTRFERDLSSILDD